MYNLGSHWYHFRTVPPFRPVCAKRKARDFSPLFFTGDTRPGIRIIGLLIVSGELANAVSARSRPGRV